MLNSENEHTHGWVFSGYSQIQRKYNQKNVTCLGHGCLPRDIMVGFLD